MCAKLVPVPGRHGLRSGTGRGSITSFLLVSDLDLSDTLSDLPKHHLQFPGLRLEQIQLLPGVKRWHETHLEPVKARVTVITMNSLIHCELRIED